MAARGRTVLRPALRVDRAVAAEFRVLLNPVVLALRAKGMLEVPTTLQDQITAAAVAAEPVLSVNLEAATRVVTEELVCSSAFPAPRPTTVVAVALPTTVQGEVTAPVDQGVAVELVLPEPPIPVVAVVAVKAPRTLELPAAPES